MKFLEVSWFLIRHTFRRAKALTIVPKEKSDAIRPANLRITRSFCGTECDEADPTSVRGGRTTRRSSKPASTSVAIHLQVPETGTTVRLKEGKRRVQDGPFADTKEQLGGFTILELPSLDAALDWAARCPAASIGAVEVRPAFA
jgi:hypothetical protein